MEESQEGRTERWKNTEKRDAISGPFLRAALFSFLAALAAIDHFAHPPWILLRSPRIWLFFNLNC
jgi:hypothetical protein